MKLKYILKGGLFAFLFAVNAIAAFADPVWATIIDIDLEGRYYQYFIDKNGDGIEDGVVNVWPSSMTTSLFKRYMQVGGRVLYEDDNRDDFTIGEGQLLRIELPDGRVIKVNDFAGEYFEFRRARDYEAQQSGGR